MREIVVALPKPDSNAHGGRQKPPKESIASGGRRARDVDVVFNDRAVHAPTTHVADALEADQHGGGPASSALAQRVPTPDLPRRPRVPGPNPMALAHATLSTD